MWLDKRSEFADGTAIGSGTGRRIVGNVMDLENERDIGSSSNIWFVLQVSTTFTSDLAGTAQFELVTDAQPALATDGSATEHLVSPVYALADLTAGKVLMQVLLPLETNTAAYERYLGVLANIGTAAMTAGNVHAFLTLQPPVHRKYPAVTGL